MAQAFLERAFGIAPFRPPLTRSGSSDSVASAVTAGSSSHAQLSESSTPPTSAADSDSISFAAAKTTNGIDVNADAEPESDTEGDPHAYRNTLTTSRSQRLRTSLVGTYNIKAMTGTAVHAPRKYRSMVGIKPPKETRRRTISSHMRPNTLEVISESSIMSEKAVTMLVNNGLKEVDLRLPGTKKLLKSRNVVGLKVGESPRKTNVANKNGEMINRRFTRSTGEPVDSFTKKLSVLGKRGRDKFEASLVKGKRELKRLADTNEFAKIDTKPVLAEVWSNGKLITGEEPPKKKVKAEVIVIAKATEETNLVEKSKPKKRGHKVWLNKGLYAGQEGRNLDWFSGLSKDERKKIINVPPLSKQNSILPLPMWHGQRLLHIGRNFKLPFDVCSPLPPGQPKPDEWRKVPKNRFVGDAAAAWKKSTVFDDFSSRCVCSPLNGCDESCQNRIMLYECDAGNCSAGREYCTNRAFTDLQERRSKGGKYRIGVEVIKTIDRGYGVRSNRCFEPHQIIVEYTGEIITEEECDRRMNEDYKENECYYLMLFDQNMIIDATRGSIARFVNHSCEPNCRMVKWIVAGKPRMALFAGDRPIMTGEELTYDYNFDPFSAKNVQECRCGAESCRGVLGPRPKDKPKPTPGLGEIMKPVAGPGKRKLEESLGRDKNVQKSPKKRKTNGSMKGSRLVKTSHASKGISRKPSNTMSLPKKNVKSVEIKRESKKVRVVKRYKTATGKQKKQRVLSSSRKTNLMLANKELKTGNPKWTGEVIKDSIALKIVRSTRKRKLSIKGKELHITKGGVSKAPAEK